MTQNSSLSRNYFYFKGEKEIKNMEKEVKVEIKEEEPLYYNDYEMNNLDYQKALKLDKRTFFEFYLSLLRVNHLLVYTFYTTNDYNIKLTKLCLFIITFVLLYVVNALFYNDATMHKIYEDKGKYDFIYQIPQMIYSTAISSIIKIILSKLTSTEKKYVK